MKHWLCPARSVGGTQGPVLICSVMFVAGTVGVAVTVCMLLVAEISANNIQ